MDKGILYLAIGEQHYTEAVASAESVRRFCDLPIALVTDCATRDDPFDFVFSNKLLDDPRRFEDGHTAADVIIGALFGHPFINMSCEYQLFIRFLAAFDPGPNDFIPGRIVSGSATGPEYYFCPPFQHPAEIFAHPC